MKKAGKIIVIVVVVIAVLGIVGNLLGGGEETEGTKAIVENTEAAGEDVTTDAAEEEPETQEPTQAASTGLPTIEEQVLVDQNGIKITAVELVDDGIWGTGLKLLIENNTDQDVGISCDALIVNNYMIANLFSATVASGMKSNETVDLYSTELEASGIENIGQIELKMHSFDGETYETIEEYDLAVIQTSEYESMDVQALDDGTELVNQDGVRIVGKYVDEDSFWGAGVLLYLENNSGRNVTVSCEDMSVNGYMITPVFAETVYDGKMSISDITIFESDLEENGITAIEDIELKFHVYDSDDYSTVFDTDAIAFSVTP